MKPMTKSEMINVFTEGMVNSFIEGEGKITPEEAYKISDCMTILSLMLQINGDEERFKEFKETVK